MVELRALSGEARLLHALARGFVSGRVHSVFRRAVNVEAAEMGLWALATADAGNAPDTLVLDAEDLAAVGIEPGDRVTADTGAIEIERRCRIAFEGAEPWRVSLPSYPADDSRLRVDVDRVCAEVEAHARKAAAGIVAERAREVLDAHARSLQDALATGDAARACAHGTAMLGLGPGLTPSGDDYLVGLFAVLNLPLGPAGRFPEVLRAIAAEAATRTNAISAAALRAAADGRVRQRVVALLRAMVSSEPSTTLGELRGVLAIGSSSGADLAKGILCGFRSHFVAPMRRGRARLSCAGMAGR